MLHSSLQGNLLSALRKRSELRTFPRQEEIAAFVGSNADYYLRKWHACLAGVDNDAGFNWAAFFLGPFWLPDRKLYLHAVALYGIMFLLFLVESTSSRDHGNGLSLLLGVFCGAFGNRWYFTHARDYIEQTRSQEIDRQGYLDKLARRGGTNWFAPFPFFAVFVLLLFSILSSRAFR